MQLIAAKVTYHSGLSWSMSDIRTQREVLRHTAKRMAIAVSLTAVMTLATVTLQLGTNLDAAVRVGHVLTLSLCAAIAISAFLSGALSYRSALLMKELTLTRAELFRISRTDKLTGLLNRRGFDEAAAAALQSAHAAKRPVAAMSVTSIISKQSTIIMGTSLVTAAIPQGAEEPPLTQPSCGFLAARLPSIRRASASLAMLGRAARGFLFAVSYWESRRCASLAAAF